MTDTPENSNAPSTRTSLASTKADFRELKTNSNATLQELQEFLRQLKGKSPQEMLGVVSTSQLFRATILSTILVTAAIFGLTAFSYYFDEEPAPTTEPVVAVPAEPIPEPAVPSPKVTTPDAPDPIDPLGVNDQLPAPPNKNPLEEKGEDFLKDLE
jgi:hypothetical protein